MRRLKLWLLLACVAAPAAAQQPPACTQNQAGTVACMSGKLCSCGYVRGGTMTGRAEGWQWDCGILRPACGEGLPPAGLNVAPSPLLMPQLDVQVPAPPISPWVR